MASIKSKAGKDKIEKVLHEYKEGALRSGGKNPVQSREQAIAIALSEARREGKRK